MAEIKSRCLYSYEENEKLTAEIEKILADTTSEHEKTKKLIALKGKVSAPISQYCIDYYLRKMKKARHNRLCRFACYSVVIAYLIFTLCRIFWFYNPEYNPFTDSWSITIIDVTVYLYLIPVILIFYHLIRRFFRKKK